ncbi:MAG: sigma-70 region 4 domain-containing protein, partial [Gemmatimonadota bacterium]|nr:sigma-70 region 4 domain-containing protein [Gemmatimonadota bacterium]
ALQRLPEVQREIVLLHDLEGWKHREIAECLGIPSGTVRSHLHFARKSLRQDADLAQVVVEQVKDDGNMTDIGNVRAGGGSRRLKIEIG